MIPFALIKPHLCLPLALDDLEVLNRAETGNAEAQTDLALIFLLHGKPKGAIYWLEMAARQGYADAMNWLGRCYLGAEGVAQDENIGMMWISKAAALGHVISQDQMQGMRDMIFRKSSEE